MTMQRRSFLASLLAGSMAPAIVRAQSIMRVAPARIIVPAPFALAFEALREPVFATTGSLLHFDAQLRFYAGAGGSGGSLLASLSLPTNWMGDISLERTGIVESLRYMSDGTVQPVYRGQ